MVIIVNKPQRDNSNIWKDALTKYCIDTRNWTIDYAKTPFESLCGVITTKYHGYIAVSVLHENSWLIGNYPKAKISLPLLSINLFKQVLTRYDLVGKEVEVTTCDHGRLLIFNSLCTHAAIIDFKKIIESVEFTQDETILRDYKSSTSNVTFSSKLISNYIQIP